MPRHPLPAGILEDPSGHSWTLASRIEDVSAEEMALRAARLAEADGG